MSEPSPLAEYLVISRGQWNESLSRHEIEKAIDQFYQWLDRLVDEGKMRRGQRLTYEGKTITQKSVITDASTLANGLRGREDSGSSSRAALRKRRSSPVAILASIVDWSLKSGLSIHSAQHPIIPSLEAIADGRRCCCFSAARAVGAGEMTSIQYLVGKTCDPSF